MLYSERWTCPLNACWRLGMRRMMWRYVYPSIYLSIYICICACMVCVCVVWMCDVDVSVLCVSCTSQSRSEGVHRGVRNGETHTQTNKQTNTHTQMLRLAGCPVAMGNAPPRIQALAKCVCLPCIYMYLYTTDFKCCILHLSSFTYIYIHKKLCICTHMLMWTV
jgi:hypothetical protein